MLAELDRLAPGGAILASSTSAFNIGEIVRGLPGQRRCVMAHPFNPPHLLPAVEMRGAARTHPALLDKACHMLAACDQMPIRLTRYIKGSLGNRIQTDLVREAMRLLKSGVADAVAIDTVIRAGVGGLWPGGLPLTQSRRGGLRYRSAWRQGDDPGLTSQVCRTTPTYESRGR